MPENDTQAAAATATKEAAKPQVAGLGKPQMINLSLQNNNGGEGAKDKDDKGEGAASGAEDGKTKEVELSDEQLKAAFAKAGIEYKGEETLTEIKKKFEPAAPPPVETEEQKKQKELDLEKRIYAAWEKSGGTMQDYVAMKALLNATEDEISNLSRAQQVAEYMKQLDLTKEEAESLVSQRYYQNKLADIEQEEGETDDEFEARKTRLEKRHEKLQAEFAKKLNSKASPQKQNAIDTFNTLKQIIAEQDLQVQKDVDYAAKATDYIQKMPRKITPQLGMVNDIEIPPVDIDVPQTVIDNVAAKFQSADARKQHFINEDGSLSYANLAPLLVKAEMYDESVRKGLLEGQTRTTAEIEKTFPHRSAQSLGLGGVPARPDLNATRKVGGFGNVRREKPTLNN